MKDIYSRIEGKQWPLVNYDSILWKGRACFRPGLFLLAILPGPASSGYDGRHFIVDKRLYLTGNISYRSNAAIFYKHRMVKN
jgi:hypothetical protein